ISTQIKKLNHSCHHTNAICLTKLVNKLLIKLDRRNGINSRSDLPQQRTYRSVYGASLSCNTISLVFCQYRWVPQLFKIVVRKGCCQYPAFCCVPVTFPCMCPFVRLVLTHA